jgi:predicted GTPase
MIDAVDQVTEQDQRIAGYVHEQFKPNIIVVNNGIWLKKTGAHE